MSDLVERLRNDQGIGINLTLCREAADEIERLRAALKLAQNLDDPLLLEIERLREALEKIAQQSPEPSNSYDPQHENYLRRVLIEIARAALATGGGNE